MISAAVDLLLGMSRCVPEPDAAEKATKLITDVGVDGDYFISQTPRAHDE